MMESLRRREVCKVGAEKTIHGRGGGNKSGGPTLSIVSDDTLRALGHGM